MEKLLADDLTGNSKTETMKLLIAIIQEVGLLNLSFLLQSGIDLNKVAQEQGVIL